MKQELYTIEKMNDIAKEKGGECLSNQYNNFDSKLIWKCSKGHIWETSLSVIKKDCWCSYCKKVARLTLKIMNKIALEKKGVCLSNEYINNKTKLKPLELDGYNEDLKIAFEYNGEQHYIPIHFFHSKLNLKEVQKRDKFKIQKCEEKGILLIVIPYTIKKNNLKDYILEKLSHPQIKNKFLQEVYNDK